jgi:uncharacterized membrane protein YecN with MAPEG domain
MNPCKKKKKKKKKKSYIFTQVLLHIRIIKIYITYVPVFLVFILFLRPKTLSSLMTLILGFRLTTNKSVINI